jgi:hypothetical protein
LSYERLIRGLAPEEALRSPFWRQAEETLVKEIMGHPLHGVRSRPYREVKGYPSWKTCIEHWLKPILFAGPLPGAESMGMEATDGVMADAIATAALFCQNQGPAYWMDPAFLEALREAEIPEFEPSDIPRNIPAGILVLPSGAIATPEGNQIMAIAFAHLLPGEKVGRIRLGNRTYLCRSEDTQSHRLICVGIADGPYTYSNNLNLGTPTASYGNRGSSPRSSQDDAVIKEIGLLTIKGLMTIYSSSGVAEEQRPQPMPTPGMSRRQQQRLTWEPTWIGRNYKAISSRTGGAGGRRRRSPRMHFRRGHQRRVPCGPGRKDRKWVQIPFKIVMEGQEVFFGAEGDNDD